MLRTVMRADGWTVAGASTGESHRHGRGAGCHFENGPRAGGAAFSDAVLVARANSFYGINGRAVLTIRGPRGVPIAP